MENDIQIITDDFNDNSTIEKVEEKSKLEESKNENNANFEENFIKNNQNSMNFEKKGKKSLKFKLLLSIIYLVIVVGLIVSITTSVLVLKNETKNFNFGFNDPDYIIIHTDNRSSSANNEIFVSGSQQYKNIMELYNNSFKISKLDAILQGKSNCEITAQESFKYISESSMSGTYIEFHYSEVQDVYINGEKYEAKNIGDESYTTVVIEVLDSEQLTEVNAYFKYRVNNTSDYSYVGLKSYAMQAQLYDFINNL